eukprot:TRINITY_DN1833_c0_g2_i1.p1 TRINITY_DN1833_c0_g2~~TRINITY_DN1833_c0_g2_i1.p1  ORF type:complete len:365 (+),score=113.96 TRINITY_DN1833_c0_g2_i1:68-1162(+)
MAGTLGSAFGLKSSAMEDLRESGKMANVTAESFVQQHASIKASVLSHDYAIGTMQASMKELENQVKAIARVMASQNVQKLTENIKLSQDELCRNLQQYVNDKNEDLRAHVEREVSEVCDTKTGLMKRIDAVEQRVLGILNTKLEEASHMRLAIKDELESLKEQIDDSPGAGKKNDKLLKQLETKFNELKCEFRNFERNHESANLEQDRQVAALSADMRSALEACTDKLAEESKSLTKSIRKHETLMEDRLKALNEAIEREHHDRLDMVKGFPNMVSSKVVAVKHDLEAKIGNVEMEIDNKVRPVFTHVNEAKRLIEEEKVHREAGDRELASRIAKEAKDRGHDQDKLVGLIGMCQSAVAKMHRL